MASMTVLGAGGFALATAGPAVGLFPIASLTCTPDTQPSSGAPILHCTVSDPAGLKTMLVAAKDSFTSFSPASLGAKCNPTPDTGEHTLTFVSAFAPTYIVTVTDCAGNKDKFRVDGPTGAVTYLKTV